ncbi:MAG: tetratricopeptide repeat protein [Odoribacteraceae bacterium]|jgi:tetratricopeptide (TPR) repeat protein|nr:tetratricopeptide repeat protein [Odoribacteraceae bacterium]
MKKRVVIWIVALAASLPSMAQQERKLIRGGNDLFNTQKFEEAEVQYRKALEREDHSYAAAFNLADALYKQKKYDEALQQFSLLAKDQADKESLGELFHNIGNTLLAQNKLDESIEAYKQSLRNRPNSQETKYNLEYARKMKQEKENQDQNKDQDKDQNKEQEQNKEQNKDQDQNKDKEQDKDKDQQNKEQDQNKDQNKEQDQNKDKEQNKEQKDQPQPGEPKISPEDAKRLLNALEAEEQKTQDKVQKDKAEALKAKRMKIEKNW